MKAKNRNMVTIALALVGGLILGWLLFSDKNNHEHIPQVESQQDQEWTCSMHPSIRQSEPGLCPICGMDLTPVASSGDMLDPHLFEMTPRAMELAQVQTMILQRSGEGRMVGLNGRVNIDQRRQATQTADVSGRIERLMVTFEGEQIHRGQAMAEIYSPELVTAQQELLQAYQMRQTNPEFLEAATAKLRNWRMSQQQIQRILEQETVSGNMIITSGQSGVVTEKLVEVGDFVERGQPLYQVADLSKMWVLLDVYENMSWIQVGDSVAFSVASLPGETFKGEINFIDPVLDDVSRVSRARIEVDNPEGLLKPEMLVRARVKGAPQEERQLTVPKTAVLWTGERSVVYVKEPLNEASLFGLREVVLGPLLGEEYVIREGLSEGEEVVVNGAFTVDAVAQLAGKPSMMSGSHGEITPQQNPDLDLRQYLQTRPHQYINQNSQEFQQELNDLVDQYLELKNALVNSDDKASQRAAQGFLEVLKKAEFESDQAEVQSFWESRQEQLLNQTKPMTKPDGLESRREAFIGLSKEMAMLISAFGSGERVLYVEHCPMANSDNGAFWISADPEIRNPYYGAAMMRCGEVVTEL